MVCNVCGKENSDDADFCGVCGAELVIDKLNTVDSTVEEKACAEVHESNVIAIIGFVLTFFIAIAGLVCSTIGYKDCKKYKAPYKELAYAGIVLSLIKITVVALILLGVAVYLMLCN